VDQLETYRQLVKGIIREHAQYKPAVGEFDIETVFDDDCGHYALVYTGWLGHRRMDGSVIHIDIRNGKIWIQHDGTEDGVANELLAAGVPHNQIVLGFKPAYRRPLTEFAVG